MSHIAAVMNIISPIVLPLNVGIFQCVRKRRLYSNCWMFEMFHLLCRRFVRQLSLCILWRMTLCKSYIGVIETPAGFCIVLRLARTDLAVPAVVVCDFCGWVDDATSPGFLLKSWLPMHDTGHNVAYILRYIVAHASASREVTSRLYVPNRLDTLFSAI